MLWLVNQIACNSSIDYVVIFVIKYFLQLHVTGIYLCITKVIWKSLLWQGGNIKREEFYFICVIHCTGLGEDEAENLPYKQSEEKANLEKLLILYGIKSKISRKSGWWRLGWVFSWLPIQTLSSELIYIASTPAKTPHLSTYLSCLSASLRRNFNKAYSNRDTPREDKSRWALSVGIGGTDLRLAN